MPENLESLGVYYSFFRSDLMFQETKLRKDTRTQNAANSIFT